MITLQHDNWVQLNYGARLRGVLPGTRQSSDGELPKIEAACIGHDPATTESYQFSHVKNAAT